MVILAKMQFYTFFKHLYIVGEQNNYYLAFRFIYTTTVEGQKRRNFVPPKKTHPMSALSTITDAKLHRES